MIDEREITNLYSTGLPILDVPPLIHRDLGAHLGSASIGAVDYVAGRENCTVFGTITPTTNQHFIYAVPFISPWFPCSVNQLQLEVSAGAAGATAFLGLFENADISPFQIGDLFCPTSILIDSGSIDTSTSGLKTVTPSPAVALRPNRLYWLCANFPAIATHATYRSIGSSSTSHSFGLSPSDGGTMINTMNQQSSTTPARWEDSPNIPNVVWALLSASFPALRYRLA